VVSLVFPEKNLFHVIKNIGGIMTQNNNWPQLDYAEWHETLETLHMWTQIVGKIRLACTPWINHSWHLTLYVTPRGLTTSMMHQGSLGFDMEFDFCHHHLLIRTTKGEHRKLPLHPRPVASFYNDLKEQCSELGVSVTINELPNEVENPIKFSEDTIHKSYNPDAVTRFAQVMNNTARIFTEFRAGFLGKCSPIHFFWGSFDLAVTRFSGRQAPPHPGGIPGLPDWITREAYSHEVYSCGFWPGGAASPAPTFYAYAYPVPKGLGEKPVNPAESIWSKEMGEFFLPYDVVRTADNPDQVLLNFLESTYEQVADLAKWDRGKLEVPEGFPKSGS
jgi:hypothetical protein